VAALIEQEEFAKKVEALGDNLDLDDIDDDYASLLILFEEKQTLEEHLEHCSEFIDERIKN